MDRFSAVTAAVVGGSGGGGSVSGGSTITVTTAETELFGKNVTISQGSTSYTGTFSQTGEAVIGGVKITGDINVRATSGVKVAETSLNVPYFGNYTVSIAFWAATVTVSTTNSQFDGLTVYAKKDGVTMASAVFSGGSSTLRVPDAGTYTFETTYEWKTYTSAELSVTEQTSYSTTLNGFFATINITTPTPEFYSGTVVVTSTGVPTTSISLDASGEGTYTALQAGDYLFTLTYGGEPYTASVTVSAETTYSAVIKMWTATIVVSTTSSELDGQTVTLENGVGTVIDTGVFSSGSVTFSVHETGTYTASVTYDNYTYTDSVTVSAETSYSATLDTWNATLAITSTTPEFASQTVTITKGGVTVGTVALVSGSASFVVHEAGTYTCTITYSGEPYVGTAVVSSQTSYPVSINMWTATLSISTTSSELYGATITITDGNGATVGTTTFDNTGAASFRVHETGTYTASVTYDGHPYTASTTVSAETTYPLTLDTWNATITITTTESSFYGETITITKGATTIGTTTFSNLGVATYTAHETGTYTFTVTVSGTPYSASVEVTAQTAYSVTLNAGLYYQAWLTAGNVSGIYADLAAVLADEEAVRQLMIIHNSVDYLATASAGDPMVQTIINNDLCAKWITLRAYAENTLSSNAAIKAMMDSAGKYGYGEWVLMPQVPKMTANDTPYGTAIRSSIYSDTYDAWKAFDGDDTTSRWNSDNSEQTPYIGYHFINSVIITMVSIKSFVGNSNAYLKDFEVQGSNDGTQWTTVYSGTHQNNGNLQDYFFGNTTAYEYYRILCKTTYSSAPNNYSLFTLQFYAWQPKGNVPVMTANDAPYGNCFGSSIASGRAYYYGFDDNNETEWYGNVSSSTTKNEYLGYTFPNPICIHQIRFNYWEDRIKNYKIQASNNGTDWNDLSDIITLPGKQGSTAKNLIATIDLDNEDFYISYRIFIIDSYVNNNAGLNNVQFYGRELKVSVPKMTANDAPWGEAIADSNYASDYPYEAFDDDDDWPWDSNQPNSASNIWVGYKFPFPVVVKKAQIAFLKYQGSTSYITSNSYKIQGSNDRFVNDIHDLSVVYTGTDDRTIDLDNDTAYLYYRVLIISQTLSASGWVCGRVVHLNFFGMNYGEYDWDANNPRHYLYDHGVEVDGALTLTTGASEEPQAIKLTAQNAQASKSLDTTSYNLLRGVEGMYGSGTNQLLCGSGSANFATDYLPYNQFLDISSINGSNATGVKQTAAGTFTCEEIWTE